MPTKAVNADVFLARCTHQKNVGYGWRYIRGD